MSYVSVKSHTKLGFWSYCETKEWLHHIIRSKFDFVVTNHDFFT